MKNYFKLCILFFASFLIFSCGVIPDEDLPNGAITEGDFHMTTLVNGEEFTTTNSRVSVFPNLTEAFSITGIFQDTTFLILGLQSPTSVGTFELTAETGIVNYIEGTTPYLVNNEVGSGEIVVTEDTSDYMEGTFSFTAINPLDNSEKEFTQGSFKAEKF